MADGDPASDYLTIQPVFTPLTPPSPSLKARVFALANAAKKDGFPIRVAIIQSPTDLGAIPQLYGLPKRYAKFLGAELRYAYHGPLLIVMKQGYGYTQNGKPVPGSAKILRSIPPPSGASPDQLTTAAIVAMRKIAAASDHILPANPPLQTNGQQASTSRSFSARHSGAIISIAIIVAITAAAGLIAIGHREGWRGSRDT